MQAEGTSAERLRRVAHLMARPALAVVDCETYPIRRAQRAPRLVALGAAFDGDPVRILARDDERALPAVRMALEADRFINHNMAFDAGVLCRQWPELVRPFFRGYAEGRVRCTWLRAQLHALACGTLWRAQRTRGALSLGGLAESVLGAASHKSSWQTRYAELDGVPPERWPREAVRYLTGDVDVERRLARALPEAPDEVRQSRFHWAAHLGSMRGLRTDRERVSAYVERCRREALEANARCRTYGLASSDGTANDSAQRALVGEHHRRLTGEDPPRTKGGKPQATDVAIAHMLHCAGPSDPVRPALEALQARKKAENAMRYVPLLLSGTRRPIMPGINPLLENGRCSYRSAPGQARGAGLQQLPRHGGVRECFVPRPGMAFVAGDWSQAELRNLAQVQIDWFGESRLAEAFRQGIDPHTMLACQLLDAPYEQGLHLKRSGDERFGEVRRLAKEANFGFPGGMGIERFVGRCRKYDLWHVDEATARRLKGGWRRLWRMQPYFDRVRSLGATIVQPRSGRVRGGMGYCDACNTFFSGPVADAAKDATFWSSYLAWCVPASPLFGARLAWFLHDELCFEVPHERAEAAAAALEDVMIRAMVEITPDVPAEADMRIMRDRWEEK